MLALRFARFLFKAINCSTHNFVAELCLLYKATQTGTSWHTAGSLKTITSQVMVISSVP